MAEKAKAWTDAEKLDLLFQIIEKAGSIPWDDLKLPEGRTKKGCMVMVDREKQKVKKAREGGGEGGELGAETPKGKRKTNGEAPSAKKAKTPRKKQVKAAADDDDMEKAETAEDGDQVKAESDGEFN